MLSFDEAAHEYRWNGIVVPGVTSIIEGAYDFRFVNADALERARVLGTKVHKTTELYDTGCLDQSKLHETLAKYLASWIQFKEECGFETTHCEQRGYSEKWGVAGTIDRIGLLRGEPFLPDIKTGNKYYPHLLQTAGYKIIAVENGWLPKSARRGSVYLYDDGYELAFHNDPMDEAAFLAQLTAKRHRDKHNVKR